MKELCFTTRAQWRKWLSQNHDRVPEGVWLVCYKKHTARKTLQYEDLVEEALCFGWIDSLVKRLDEDRYARKVTPRKPNSRWSPTNKKRVERLLDQGLIAEPGRASIEAAKRSGLWDAPLRPEVTGHLPVELANVLSKSKKARTFFEQLAPSHRSSFIGWVGAAKRPETRARRAQEALQRLKQGQLLGLK